MPQKEAAFPMPEHPSMTRVCVRACMFGFGVWEQRLCDARKLPNLCTQTHNSIITRRALSCSAEHHHQLRIHTISSV